jgi:adenine-specific DNA-methyltransferase
MERVIHPAKDIPHELGAFAQESTRLWQRHTHGLQVDPKQRSHGVVYTPNALVNTLVSLVLDELRSDLPGTVLDPSCGTGNFVVETYERLVDRLVSPTVESRITLLRDSVFGCDIDAQALEIAKRRLWQVALQGTDEWVAFAEFPHSNFVVGDALSLVPENDVRQLLPGAGWGLWLESVLQKRFDVIVGNPPYGKTRLSGAQRQYFAESLYGHANTYGLFLHLGVELLKPDGVMGYVVPASMLSGLYFQNLRKYLAQRSSFRAIVQFDQREGIFESVLQEVMLLVVQRGQAIVPYTVRVATVEREGQMADFSTFLHGMRQVSSETVLRQSGGYDLIHVPTRQGADAVYEKYEKLGAPLTDASVGYVARTGPIVWNRLRTLLRDGPAENALPLVWANNVSGYHFLADGNRDKQRGYLECNERTASLVIHGPCLLVQRITAKEQRRRIVAAFPLEWEQAKGSFFVENHLNLIVPIKGVTPLSPEVVLALLNSRLFDFIFRTINGNTQVSATELNVMRFPRPETTAAGQIAELVGQLQRAWAVGQVAQVTELTMQLDQMVYGLYGLTPDEIKVVESHTRGVAG